MSDTFELAESAVTKFANRDTSPIDQATLTLEEYKASLVRFYYYWHERDCSSGSMAVDEWLRDVMGE